MCEYPLGCQGYHGHRCCTKDTQEDLLCSCEGIIAQFTYVGRKSRGTTEGHFNDLVDLLPLPDELGRSCVS